MSINLDCILISRGRDSLLLKFIFLLLSKVIDVPFFTSKLDEEASTERTECVCVLGKSASEVFKLLFFFCSHISFRPTERQWLEYSRIEREQAQIKHKNVLRNSRRKLYKA